MVPVYGLSSWCEATQLRCPELSYDVMAIKVIRYMYGGTCPNTLDAQDRTLLRLLPACPYYMRKPEAISLLKQSFVNTLMDAIKARYSYIEG